MISCQNNMLDPCAKHAWLLRKVLAGLVCNVGRHIMRKATDLPGRLRKMPGRLSTVEHLWVKSLSSPFRRMKLLHWRFGLASCNWKVLLFQNISVIIHHCLYFTCPHSMHSGWQGIHFSTPVWVVRSTPVFVFHIPCFSSHVLHASKAWCHLPLFPQVVTQAPRQRQKWQRSQRTKYDYVAKTALNMKPCAFN